MPSALWNKLFSLWQYGKHFFLAKRSGHGVHSPFVYSLCEDIFYNKANFYDFGELYKLRIELLQNKNQIRIKEFGAGSRHFKHPDRRICDIAKYGISDDQKSRLFYRLINYFNCMKSIELGTSLGLNAVYMGLANRKGQVYSLEGDPALSEFARDFITKNGAGNIQVLEGEFNSTLPELLDRLEITDFAFVDGNHRFESTLNYFELLLHHCNSNSILVFDDIYWSRDMNRAWVEITKHPKVKLSIDLFYFGIVFFKEELLTKSNFRIWI